MPLLGYRTLATKVRGVGLHQGLLWIAMTQPERVQEIRVDKLLNVWMKFDRYPAQLIGHLHSKWSWLLFQDISVESFQFTGGWPTGYHTLYGELRARIGVNLQLRHGALARLPAHRPAQVA